jgi:hypothetical protein
MDTDAALYPERRNDSHTGKAVRLEGARPCVAREGQITAWVAWFF